MAIPSKAMPVVLTPNLSILIQKKCGEMGGSKKFLGSEEDAARKNGRKPTRFDHNTYPVDKATLDRYEGIKKWNGKCDNPSGIDVEKSSQGCRGCYISK